MKRYNVRLQLDLDFDVEAEDESFAYDAAIERIENYYDIFDALEIEPIDDDEES